MSDKIEYSRLLLKRSSISGATPTVATGTTLNELIETDLLNGEMFLNTADERAWVNLGGEIREFNLLQSGVTASNDFCTTGLKTSALSGCSPINVYTDLTLEEGLSSINSSYNQNVQINFEKLFGRDTIRLHTDGGAFSGASVTVLQGSGQISSQVAAYGTNGYVGLYTDSSYLEVYDGSDIVMYSDGDMYLSTGAGDIIANTNVNLPTISFNSGTDKWKFVELEIGDWDMGITANKDIAHGLSSTEWKTIRQVNAIIRNDSDAQYYNIGSYGNANEEAYLAAFNSTNIRVTRITSGFFDISVFFNSTSYNRGWITFWYKPD
jgi:hypothetical protein